MDTWQLDKDGFLGLMEKLIGETESLQNWPEGGLIPREDLAARHILNLLEPYKHENGGSLKVDHIHLKPDSAPERGNIIIQYPHSSPSDSPVVSFVGSHLDVVFANKEHWDKDPFKLSVEGDVLYGRGTTDCLGHCALLTQLFLKLEKERPDLHGKRVVGVIICDEEAGGGGEDSVGVEGLQSKGYLDNLKPGPLIWLDCANKQPNVGSGGIIQWELKAIGKMGHSGFPHKAINTIELATLALEEVQEGFYAAFPRHEKEAEYGFECSSSLKPTRSSLPDSSMNQIAGEYSLKGDIRLIPFYSIHHAMKVVEDIVQRINTEEGLHHLETKAKLRLGPDSKFILYANEDGDEDDSGSGNGGEKVKNTKIVLQGKVQLTWLCSPIQGLACSLSSTGYTALCEATKEIVGSCNPIADTGSLPLVADLQLAGFDVQTVGYGLEDYYHADNECALLSDYEQGFRVLVRIIMKALDLN